ncbi:protein-glutamate methylesterase/protein-glutamine glutaminase [Cognatazoarcus halotolerans]|uniref:protein-glutamate methylesterase/protein-glutamine glutaminase n=1 Tax=Cognatazoarcus halotolerans TaxID=2686016 RepID=UPI00135A6E0C|nr:chemotaxis response regulator protein-glutamate methylesterase [Cognatazoarcus halotolerans]MCB1900137.1 chemotaxis response regulator protein-glutamate methylesterase [Rhodocyclaceae bacterium]MCP5311320.1 chemotaxis response regulator protein-glutamate methylesterase [Zoogloeaceae bacterium]
MPIKVFICDDSVVMRSLLTEIINGDPRLKVVGAAPDPIAAREMIKTLNPDVLTLDVEMPRMDGLEFLDRLMRLRPMPVVMISSLTERGSSETLRALELGAVDFMQKPGQGRAMSDLAWEICDKIKTAYLARPRQTSRVGGAHDAAPTPAGRVPERTLREKIVVLGASTGGTEAIREVLTRLPEAFPPVLIVQHMPEMFTNSFARRLDGLCALTVQEAAHGDRIKPGHVYIAPGHSHLLLKRVAGGMQCELSRADPVNRHRPSVDVLFNSAAPILGSNGLGVLLTGMGKDGAQGMLALREAGAWTIAQDQDSCVVWGMPREAVAVGAACEVAPLADVAGRLIARLQR